MSSKCVVNLVDNSGNVVEHVATCKSRKKADVVVAQYADELAKRKADGLPCILRIDDVVPAAAPPAVQPESAAPPVVQPEPAVPAAADADTIVIEPAAAENETEKAEREKKTTTAAKALDATVLKIAKDWAATDRAARGWLVEIGGRCASYLSDYVALYGAKRPDGVKKLKELLLLHTGEDHGADVPRCLQHFFAASYFDGAEGQEVRFSSLPITSQKAFAALFQQTDEIDKEGKATGNIVYTLDGVSPETAVLLYDFAHGNDDGIKEWIAEPTYTKPFGKDGASFLVGTDVTQLCKLAKERAKAAPPVVQTGTTTNPPAGATTEATAPPAPAEGTGAAAKKKRGQQAAAPDKAPVGLVLAPEKPELAGADLASAVVAYPKASQGFLLAAIGRNESIPMDTVVQLVTGVSERSNRADALQVLKTAVLREIAILATMGKDPKLDRLGAIALLQADSAERLKRATA